MMQVRGSSERSERLAYLERRRQVRGLVMLAVAVLIFSVLRAGVHRVFGVGWWRLW